MTNGSLFQCEKIRFPSNDNVCLCHIFELDVVVAGRSEQTRRIKK